VVLGTGEQKEEERAGKKLIKGRKNRLKTDAGKVSMVMILLLLRLSNNAIYVTSRGGL
jgi:hypothetical protein